VALTAVALAVVLVSSASAVGPTYSSGFEIDTAGWTNDFGGTITRKASGFTNPGGYANTVPSAAGDSNGRCRDPVILELRMFSETPAI
jgi:hypothetical protein